MSVSHTGITERVLAYTAPDPATKEFEPPKDRAFFADPEKKALFSAVKQVRHLTPYIGTELVGVQLSQLNDAQKDELALLVAERGVVFFRDQDLTTEGQHEFTKHFGIQNRDPNQVDPNHVTIIGRDNDIRAYADFSGEYHSDDSHEVNPPAYTMLRMLKTPEFGGDTIWTSQTALFDKLSPTFQHMFEGLHAVHSSEIVFVNAVNGGGQPLRAPVRRDHPLVRTHPVTHLKSLFYNPLFTLHIRDLKAQESTHTLNFLREHLHAADDLSVRWKWEPHSVAYWDNRIVAHRALPGGYDVSQREGKRTAIFGEKPVFDKERGESWSERMKRLEGEKGKGEAEGEGAKLHFRRAEV